MEFVYKMAFYVMFGITVFIILYLMVGSISMIFDPYSKKMEIVYYLIGCTILGIGLYKSYNIIKISDEYMNSCGVLGITWIVTLVFIVITLLFFNGPFRWQ
ncbi:MAG: hypothetical protein IPL55_13290 [Saprospiraceae bacterium]|nr:hypothetical protein [Saprospiraceae bacterium]MBL0024366.1 hypothetical protein [Saprospiraceae bacterium]